MRFQRKKIRKQIEDILNLYIETEKHLPRNDYRNQRTTRPYTRTY